MRPLSALGVFESRLPGVGRSDIADFKDEDGSWKLTWFNVVLADTDDQLTSNTVPGMNMVLSIVFRTRAGEVLRGVLFALAPFTALQLDGEPPSYAAGLTEGFFLSQERQSGQWQLRWRALGTPKVFEGNITVETTGDRGDQAHRARRAECRRVVSREYCREHHHFPGDHGGRRGEGHHVLRAPWRAPPVPAGAWGRSMGPCKPSPASSCVLVPRTNRCPRAWTQRILN